MIQTTLEIEGMTCEVHICGAIRRAVPSVKKITASRSKKEASFLTKGAADADLPKTAVDATGYYCLSVESAPYEKKGWFELK